MRQEQHFASIFKEKISPSLQEYQQERKLQKEIGETITSSEVFGQDIIMRINTLKIKEKIFDKNALEREHKVMQKKAC